LPAEQFAHGRQAVALLVRLKLPDGHGVHARSSTAVPCEATKSPAGHVFLATQAVAGSPSSSHRLSLHAAAGVLPPAQYWPALHFEHESDVEAAEATCWVPAGQSEAAKHTDWLDPFVVVPAAQVAQVRLTDAVGAVATYVPAAHTLQAVHVELLVTALKVPAGQVVQERSEVAVPVLETNVPGAQSFHFEQVLPEMYVPSLHVGTHVPPTQVLGF
jgi:hypothetical protein